MENKDLLEIVFVRHAETCYEDTGDRDRCDGNLNENGEKQCKLLGKKLKDMPIDAYITSSLLRSFKTAAGVCKEKADKPLLKICPELVECGCSVGYYGCSEEYLKKYYDNSEMCEKLFGTDEYEFGCEAYEDNVARAQKVIEYIKENFTFGDRVAVFSHHGFLEYLIPVALGIKPHTFFFALDNVSISVIDFCKDGKAILRCVNEKGTE